MSVICSDLLKYYNILPSRLQRSIFLKINPKYFDLWEQLYPFTFLNESSLVGQTFPEKDYPQVIQFGMIFNKPIDKIKFPPSLLSLSFGNDFNQPINHVQFPSSLQFLTFGYGFNQPIDKVKFPSSLQSLTFGYKFNQPIDTLPETLTKLELGVSFIQPIRKLPILLKSFKLLNNSGRAKELLNQVRAKREEIFELIQMVKSDSDKGLGKIQEINNLFQIISYRDSRDYTGKTGVKLLEMYQDWSRSH